MSTLLCNLSSGNLREAPLAALLIEALRLDATGELVIEAEDSASRVYFHNGVPCGAQPGFGFQPLGQFLLEKGWIDVRALERSLVAVADGRKQGEALVSLGVLSESQLTQALNLHHAAHLQLLAHLSDGSYRFHPTDRLPSWSHNIRLPVYRVILDALATPAGRHVSSRILRGLPEGCKLRLAQGWERHAEQFHFDEAEGHFLSKLTEPRELSETLGTPGLESTRLWALLATLCVAALLVPHGPAAPRPEELFPSQPVEDYAERAGSGRG